MLLKAGKNKSPILMERKKMDEKQTEVNEAMTTQQRMKMKQSMRRNKAKIALGRKKASKRLASKEVLMKRATKAARNVFLKKMLKDKDKGDLSYAARKGYEDRLSKKKSQIKTMAKKMLRDVRKKDRSKFKK